MIDSELAVSVAALFASLVSLSVSILKKKSLSLAEIAVRSVAYGEQMGSSPAEKLRHAVASAQRLDAGDNGKRDFSDAQLRIAIEAELARSKR